MRRAQESSTRGCVLRHAARRPFEWCLVAVTLAAGAPACSNGGGPDGATWQVRDSAGIRIVESHAPASDGEWTLGETLLSVGTANGAEEQQLHRVVGAVRLSDGSIVIADAGSGELRRYTAPGGFLGALGRIGDGPGEFRALSWIGRMAGDTLVTWDRRHGRATVWTVEGRVRDVRPTLPEAQTGRIVAGGFDDGGLVLLRGASFVPVDGEPGVQRQPLTVSVVDRAGSVVAEIGPFGGEEVWIRPGASPGSTLRTEVPFGRATVIAAGRGHVFVADNASWNLHVHHAQGSLERIVRRPHEPVGVRPADVEHHIAERLRPLPPVEEIRAGMRASLEAVPAPERMPAIRALVVSTAGDVWVEAGRSTADATAMWSVFDAEGRWMSDVAIPTDHEVLEVGPDYLIALVRDALEVEQVRVIELRRGG